MKKPIYRKLHGYAPILSYSESKFSDREEYANTLWGTGYYLTNFGECVQIRVCKNYPKSPDTTTLSIYLDGKLWEVEHFKTFSDRGLMLACNNFIKRTYTENA